MANPLRNEAQIYETIQKERIRVSVEVWDLMYHRVGDCLSAITLMCEYYIGLNQSMPIEDGKKILDYISRIKEIIGHITKKISAPNQRFPEFQANPGLHPVINEMFMHYIPNDTNIMSLIIEDAIDPIDPHSIPPDCLLKISGYCRCSREFMERIRKATL